MSWLQSNPNEFQNLKLSEQKSTIVCNVFPLSVDPIDRKAIFFHGVIGVLFHDTLSPIPEVEIRLMVPPIFVVTILVKLPSTIIKSMSDLVTNDKSNGTKVEITGDKCN